MKDNLLAFLQALEAVVPPREYCHHSICLAGERLALYVQRGDQWISFFLESGELELGADLVPKVLDLLDAVDAAMNAAL